jgi:molecular chaperone GrpE (heat shock protein)
MAKPIKIADEFASAMQQLSAEASGSLSPADQEEAENGAVSNQLVEVLQEVRALSRRIDSLETTLSKGVAAVTPTAAPAQAYDFAKQFQKLDDQLALIRSSETLNKRLFDSLHDELIGYRDNFLHESLQKPFIKDLIVLFDDLTGVSGQLAAANRENERPGITQPLENLNNAIHALMEVLHRMDVKEVEPKDVVDRAYHKVVSYEPTDFQEDDGRIVMRVKRGFLWRDRLLRPEEVIARRFE